jgi:hypothetical protein
VLQSLTNITPLTFISPLGFTRFVRSRTVGERPEGRPQLAGLLSWGSSIAPSPTSPSLRPLPPRPSPGLRPGAATHRTRSVPAVPPGFNGLLRRGSSPEAGAFDGVRVCCTPQPALGFAMFPTPGRPHGLPRPEGHFEVFPNGDDPSKLFPLRQPNQVVTASPSSRRVPRSPNGVPSRR